ncbi:probable RNA polymerase II nuclear localization protein SLC7A6OS [Maniola jurtina]|uniref:probable RNA polymerase II nuclear localization protein SLC7A6OS n=1 Tax=Maniola jurtina TaxID=191418 RepID=UPI001E685E31|nr:probable RNA polymerase II nuclear localization protein SLC7A6OS [Maniola jurtina]
MAASTVLRVKRRLEDNPQDALVLVCKRRKTDSDEVSPSLFVFRGSVETQEPTHVKNIAPLANITPKQVTNVNDIIQKMRKQRKEFSTESRYEIVNLSRGLKEESDFDLVDLQKKEDEKTDVEYIYDLYTPAKEDFDISMLDNLVSIENYETDLIFGSYRDNGLQSSEEDSEDSNAENDWRNEYPDSDPSSIDEEDMIKAVEKCNIEDDLSSDAGEDKIYDEPADLYHEDVKRYGEAYAKYKARVLSEQPDLAEPKLSDRRISHEKFSEENLADSRNFVHCTKMDDDGYKGDSDDGFYYGQDEDSEQFKEQYADVSDTSDVYEPD